MSKHTPGPWTIEKTIYGQFWIKQNGVGFSIALMGKPDDPHVDSEANARLIAAAPEMLSALKRLLAADDELADEGNAESMSSAIRAAHAAIAKAEGRHE